MPRPLGRAPLGGQSPDFIGGESFAPRSGAKPATLLAGGAKKASDHTKSTVLYPRTSGGRAEDEGVGLVIASRGAGAQRATPHTPRTITSRGAATIQNADFV